MSPWPQLLPLCHESSVMLSSCAAVLMMCLALQIWDDMVAAGVQPDRKTHEHMVFSHIVQRNTSAMLTALQVRLLYCEGAQDAALLFMRRRLALRSSRTSHTPCDAG